MTEIQLINVPNGDLGWNTKYDTNFKLLKQLADSKSDGVVTHILTEKNGLTLCKGVTSAVLMVIDFKESALVIARAHLDNSIAKNTWTDTFYAPTSLFHDYYANNDYLSDMENNYKTLTHMLCDPKRGTFPTFVYGDINGDTYAGRMFLLQRN